MSLKSKLLPISAALISSILFVNSAYADCLTSKQDKTITKSTNKLDNCVISDTDGVVYTTTEIPNQQARIVIDKSITAKNTALSLPENSSLRYDLIIGGDLGNQNNATTLATDPVTIRSENGVAIQYLGKMMDSNRNINILPNTTIVGKDAITANNLDESKRNFAINLVGVHVEGNIQTTNGINSGQTNIYNKVIFANKYTDMNVASPQATHKGYFETHLRNFFRGEEIKGFNVIQNFADLTIASGNNGSNWHNANFTSESNSSINFLLENANLENPFISSDLIQLKTTNLKLTLAENLTVEDITNKTIVLLKANTKLTGANNITNISLEKFDGSNPIVTSPASKKDDSWLVTQKSSMIPRTWSDELTLYFSVEQSPGVIIVVEPSLTEFMKLSGITQPVESDFVANLVKGALNNTGSEAETIVLQHAQNQQAKVLARSLLPDLSMADFNTSMRWGNQLSDHVEQRYLSYRHQLSEFERTEQWNPWVNINFANGTNKSIYGYGLERWGLQLGMDRQVNNEALVGLSASINRNIIDSSYSNLEKNQSQVLFMPYVEYTSGKIFYNANILGGFYNVDSVRTIGSSKATGSYAGFQYGYQLGTGLNLENEWINIRPQLTLKEQWLQNQGWKESGSPFALETKKQKMKVRYAGVGLSLWQNFKTSVGDFAPILELMYNRHLNNRAFDPTFRLANTNDKGTTFYFDNLTSDQLNVKAGFNYNAGEYFNFTTNVSVYKTVDYKELVYQWGLATIF